MARESNKYSTSEKEEKKNFNNKNDNEKKEENKKFDIDDDEEKSKQINIKDIIENDEFKNIIVNWINSKKYDKNFNEMLENYAEENNNNFYNVDTSVDSKLEQNIKNKIKND